MSPELFQRVRDAVDAVRALPTAERTAYLETLDPDVRKEAADLLAYEKEAAAVDRPLVPSLAETEALPASVGRYRVVSSLGEGGMGRVYLARQEQPQREVAIKVVRAGMLSRSVLRRFELEAELLGQLQHPGIAQILEAGVADVRYGDGRSLLQPFYAMEYVRGVPLTTFVEGRGLPLRARLALVAEVADAVEHAHRRGIIHRDLKPANILIGEDGRPKILDFGVARALDSDLRATTQTHAGQIIGTLAYMSPEQTLGDSRGIDTRSDVYSLGVVLYEALTGRLPIDVRQLPLPEAARSIREDEPTRAGSLIADLRGDPETITAKAIEKDRDRRYESAGALAADLRRYLADEPIFARPASTLYQLRKFAKRNKPLVGGVVATVLVLAGGAVTTSIAAARAARQRTVAEQRGREADRAAYRATIAAAQAGLEAGDGPLVRRSLDAADPALRGWEWRYFSFLADRSVLALRDCFGESGMFAVSDSGAWLACLDRAGRVRVLDAATGAPRWPAPPAFAGGPLDFDALRFAASDSLVLVLTGRSSLTAMDAATGAPRWRYDLPGLWDVRGSPDGSQVALVGRDLSDLILLDAASGTVARRIPIPSAVNYFVGYAADGRSVTLQTFVNSFSWRYWNVDVQTGDVREAPIGASSWHWQLADGRLVGIVVDAAGPALVDHADGRPLGRARAALTAAAGPVALSADGRLLAAIEDGSSLRLMDVGSGQTAFVEHLPSHAHSIQFVPPGRIATPLEDGSLRVWDVRMGPAPFVFPTSDRRSTGIAAITPDGRRFLLADWGDLGWWDTSTGRRLASAQMNRGQAHRIFAAPAGDRFALATQLGAMSILSVNNDALTLVDGPRMGTASFVRWAAWTQDGSALWVSTDAGELCRLDGASGAVLSTAPRPQVEDILAESGTDVLLAEGDRVSLLSRDDLAPRWTRTIPGLEAGKSAAAFSADGARVGLALPGRLVFLSAADGRTEHEWTGAEAGARAAVWTPDGRRFLALSSAATLKFIDPGTGDETAALRVGEMRHGTLRFSPDAASLVMVGDGQARILETGGSPAVLALRDLVRRAREIVDPLYDRFRIADDVARAVSDLPDLDPDVRRECLRAVAARGIDVNRLNERAWAVVADATNNPEHNEQAVRFARACVAAMPRRWDTLNTLALAELRAGDAARALTVSDRCLEVYQAQTGGEHPVDLAIRGIILAVLKRPDDARAALARIPAGPAATPEVRRLADEALRRLNAPAAR